MWVASHPRVLILHLERFGYIRGRRFKRDDAVLLPLQGLARSDRPRAATLSDGLPAPASPPKVRTRAPWLHARHGGAAARRLTARAGRGRSCTTWWRGQTISAPPILRVPPPLPPVQSGHVSSLPPY